MAFNTFTYDSSVLFLCVTAKSSLLVKLRFGFIIVGEKNSLNYTPIFNEPAAESFA